MPSKSKRTASSDRPRMTRRNDRDEARSAIVAIAIDLFRKNGYARTSVSDIAREMGMDPSSLYHYFPSKSAIFSAILSPEEHVPGFELLEELSDNRAEQLYAVIVRDTVYKCELPFDFIEMELVANDNKKHFQSFFEHYRAFYQNLVALIEAGAAEGTFIPLEADECAVTILSINEGLQHHYHAKHRGQLILEASGYTVRNHTPEDIGHMSARSIIPSILASNEDFDRISKNGMKLYYRLESLRS